MLCQLDVLTGKQVDSTLPGHLARWDPRLKSPFVRLGPKRATHLDLPTKQLIGMGTSSRRCRLSSTVLRMSTALASSMSDIS